MHTHKQLYLSHTNKLAHPNSRTCTHIHTQWHTCTHTDALENTVVCKYKWSTKGKGGWSCISSSRRCSCDTILLIRVRPVAEREECECCNVLSSFPLTPAWSARQSRAGATRGSASATRGSASATVGARKLSRDDGSDDTSTPAAKGRWCECGCCCANIWQSFSCTWALCHVYLLTDLHVQSHKTQESQKSTCAIYNCCQIYSSTLPIVCSEISRHWGLRV